MITLLLRNCGLQTRSSVRSCYLFLEDNFKYRYYFTGPLSDLTSLPTDPKPASSDYPFALKCYRGCTQDQIDNGDSRCASAEAGYTDAHIPVARTGITEIFESAEATANGRKCGGTGSTGKYFSKSPHTTLQSSHTGEFQKFSKSPHTTHHRSSLKFFKVPSTGNCREKNNLSSAGMFFCSLQML